MARKYDYIKKVVIFGEKATCGVGFVTSEGLMCNPEVPKNSFVPPKPTDIKENIGLILCSSG